MKMFDQWRGMRAYQRLPASQRAITFYSEGPAYGVHMEPILDNLLDHSERAVAYLTSEPYDPILDRDHPQLSAFFIGAGSARTALFKALEPTVMVMSTPDLENMYLKRSIHPVHYVYVHHSLVSTHMVYNEGAFDHFDTIFCVGPHHEAETRAREKQTGLPPKEVFEHGYGRLDGIIEKTPTPEPIDTNAQKRLLIAPS